MPGLFIVLEGIDGAGTTSQAKRLCKSLISRDIDCHLTREPTDGPIGRLLREILRGEHVGPGESFDATSLGLLFAADRADHLQREVLPALARGAVVISDRYYHSSLAYQGSDEDRKWIATLNERAKAPDYTFFLQVDPQIAAQRRADDNRDDELFDRLETQKRVAAGYEEVIRSLGATEKIETIDGHQSLDAISEAILETTLSLCKINPE